MGKRKKVKSFLKEHHVFLLIGFVAGALISVLFIILTSIKNKTTSSNNNRSVSEEDRNPAVLESRNEVGPTTLPPATQEAKLKLPIITYHYVEYVKDQGDTIRKSLDILPAVFERELKMLEEAHYETHFVREIPDILNHKINYSTKRVFLTFDDGYEDFYFNVFPLLKKYRMKATIYLVNDFIGRRGFLNKKEIKEIIDSELVEVGAHTLDHVYLKYARGSVAKHQIMESKKELENDFGIEVKTFAYPYGAFSDEAVQLVKEASFSAAVATIPGSIQSKENLFILSRYRAGMFSGNIVAVLENLKK